LQYSGTRQHRQLAHGNGFYIDELWHALPFK